MFEETKDEILDNNWHQTETNPWPQTESTLWPQTETNPWHQTETNHSGGAQAVQTGKTVYKIALIGAAGVGKSSIMQRLCGRPFEPRYTPTVGQRDYVLEMGDVCLHIKEYPGQERFQTVYDTDIDGILVVTTASAVDTRIAFEIMRQMPYVPHCFVENKGDIRVNHDNLSCSAKTQHNLMESFEALVNIMIEND